MRNNVTNADGVAKSHDLVTDVETLTASKTLTAADHGKTFFIATDALVITLPLIGDDPADGEVPLGFSATFVNSGAAGNNIITLAPNALDGFNGVCHPHEGANADATTVDGLVVRASGAVDKDWVNTKATAHTGDRCTVVAMAATKWLVKDCVGDWASEA